MHERVDEKMKQRWMRYGRHDDTPGAGWHIVKYGMQGAYVESNLVADSGDALCVNLRINCGA